AVIDRAYSTEGNGAVSEPIPFPSFQTDFEIPARFRNRSANLSKGSIKNSHKRHKGKQAFVLLVANGSFPALLGDYEGLGIHPVGITQLTECTDLELVNSAHDQTADGHLLGTGNRHRRPGAESPRALKCIMHFKEHGAPLIFGLHNNVAAVGPAIDRVERR